MDINLDIQGGDLSSALQLDPPVVETVTSDYEKLDNKPSIENVELIGNRTFEQLGYGIASFTDIDHILYG